MKLSILLLAFLLFSNCMVAQPYAIGRIRIELQDQSRNRTIPVEVYYPAQNAGNNAAWAPGFFPMVILGHGFAMTYAAYENLSGFFVPKGYVFAMIDTENGLISVSHPDFAADYQYVMQNLELPNVLSNSIAFLGHSMGGGAAFLAASQEPQPQLLVGLAPAETNPSAIGAANSINCPVFVFSGQGDAVTPPSENHSPMYDASNSLCKGFINILGGAHCYFASSNFFCDFGETTAGSSIQISRSQQQDVVYDFLEPLLATFLKNDNQAFAQFSDSLASSSRVSGTHTCDVNALETLSHTNIDVLAYPSPVNDLLSLSSPSKIIGAFQVINSLGKVMITGDCLNQQLQLNVSEWPNGVYYFRTAETSKKIIKTGP
jgi:dienelactone hydrolase